jgi:adenosylmethionine-8-amino-7-oxononanoate aminotransferase
VIQLSPPLIAGPQEFDRIVEILAEVLEEAWQELVRRSAALATT